MFTLRHRRNTRVHRTRELTAPATGAFLVLLSLVCGCAAPGETPQDKRDHIQGVRETTLNDLYAAKPEAREEIEKAAGYGVFSNREAALLFLGSGNGYGVVVDNATDETTYMRMAEVSAGLGLGLKDFRGVFVFLDRQALRQFVDKGWQFGAQASAAAKAGGEGAETSAEGVVGQPAIKIYELTNNGAFVRASIPLTKYWKYDELNRSATH